MAAFQELARISPPHVGSRVDVASNELVRVCTRCGVEERKLLPGPISVLRGKSEAVPPGLDDELFAWMRGFAVAHRSCEAREPDGPSAN